MTNVLNGRLHHRERLLVSEHGRQLGGKRANRECYVGSQEVSQSGVRGKASTTLVVLWKPLISPTLSAISP